MLQIWQALRKIMTVTKDSKPLGVDLVSHGLLNEKECSSLSHEI
jgi:hypothetical protein